MLILTRSQGEKIMIGDDIVVSVASVVGTKVRLGITAPIDVNVDREEVRMRKNAGALRPKTRGGR